MSAAPMTKAERTELAVLVKARAKTAKGDVDRRVADLKADVERRLAAKASAQAPAFVALTDAARNGVQKLDAMLAERCQLLGIPEEFRPELKIHFYGRGENAMGERRGEIRRTAFAVLDAAAIDAKHRIARAELEQRERLAAGVLMSDEAQAFLSAMPSVDELIPPKGLPGLADTLASLEVGGQADLQALAALGLDSAPALSLEGIPSVRALQ
jgi:hypothetical protein